MDMQSTSVSARRGTPGLDIFKIAGRSISGFLPSFKTGDPNRIRQPFTTIGTHISTVFRTFYPLSSTHLHERRENPTGQIA